MLQQVRLSSEKKKLNGLEVYIYHWWVESYGAWGQDTLMAFSQVPDAWPFLGMSVDPSCWLIFMVDRLSHSLIKLMFMPS